MHGSSIILPIIICIENYSYQNIFKNSLEVVCYPQYNKVSLRTHTLVLHGETGWRTYFGVKKESEHKDVTSGRLNS